MALDDHDDDNWEPRPPLPPEDRLWRHPSELAASSTPAAAPRTRWRGPALAGLAVSAAVLALGVLFLQQHVGDDGHGEVAASATTVRAAAPTVLLAGAPASTSIVSEIRVRRSHGWTASTGIWLDGQGTVLTAAGAVDGAVEIRVIDTDGTSHTARLIGVDAPSGLAALDVGATSGEIVELGAHRPTDGTAATALIAGDRPGRPHEVPLTITAAGRTEVQGEVVHDSLRLDAPLPDRSQGAPVLGPNGTVVALVIGNDVSGYAAAVPADQFMTTVDALRDDGTVRRALLGVQVFDAESSTGAPVGAAVRSVDTGGAAEAADIRPDDVVVAFDGTQISDASALVIALRAYQPGDEVTFTLRRSGRTIERTAVLD